MMIGPARWRSLGMVMLGCLLVSGCAVFYNPDQPASVFLETYRITPPLSPDAFMTCNHYGCNGGGATVGLKQQQWQVIESLFAAAAIDAEAERASIATAIALMEGFIGPQNNTVADQACNNFKAPIKSYQHDCVAEASNTTIYLLLMQQAGLLRWHKVAYPAHRAVVGVLFPHYSAVIKEFDNEALYAVDSWFYANAEPAVVVPLTQWRNNYNPSGCL